MPSTATNAHARSHSLLLLQKLLNLRDGASPLTLILDSLEKKAQPLLTEFISRAQIGRSKVIQLSFASLKKPKDVDVQIKASGKSLSTVRSELLAHYPFCNPSKPNEKPTQRIVVIIDSLNALASSNPQNLSSFLTSIITPAVSLLAVYHVDIPVVLPRSWNEYEPHPFTLLVHLATAILRLSSLRQEIERLRARNRSLVEPEWGLHEEREGVLIGLHDKNLPVQEDDKRGVVIAMELRRRSGRTVTEKFILTPPTLTPSHKQPTASSRTGRVCLLTDHGLFAPPREEAQEGEEEPESTFSLGLTEKQRKDREGIVLPYFDAQSDVGGGEGGRILYEMVPEDDFDEEEDEI